jgi:hypothetical protein
VEARAMEELPRKRRRGVSLRSALDCGLPIADCGGGRWRAKGMDGWIPLSGSVHRESDSPRPGIQPHNLEGGGGLGMGYSRSGSLAGGGWGARMYEITKRTQLPKCQAEWKWGVKMALTGVEGVGYGTPLHVF